MKRFTETTKWRDPWFRKLSPLAKLLWFYITDNCNSVGIIDLDMEAAAFDIGKIGAHTVSDAHLQELSSRVKQLDNGKLFIMKFIKFQYGWLSDACPAHKPILKLANETGLQKTETGYDYPNARVFESKQNGTLELTQKPQEQAWSPSPLQLRLGALFKRKPATRWSRDELKSFKEVGLVSEEDLRMLETYYTAKFPPDKDYRRRDLTTLLNNFNGEVDRARQYKPATCF